VHEESRLVVVSFAAELTVRMTFTSVSVPLSQMLVILRRCVQLMLTGQSMLVVNAQRAHLQVVISRHMFLESDGVSLDSLAHTALTAPQGNYFVSIVQLGEEHLAFVIKIKVRATALAPNVKTIE
jgi:hypothetical protein